MFQEMVEKLEIVKMAGAVWPWPCPCPIKDMSILEGSYVKRMDDDRLSLMNSMFKKWFVPATIQLRSYSLSFASLPPYSSSRWAMIQFKVVSGLDSLPQLSRKKTRLFYK